MEPGTAWDFHRSVSSAIVNRRDHLTPRGPEGRTVTFSSRTATPQLPGASAQLGAWHAARGRTVTPPALSLPGPFVTAHYWTALAAYLSRESSSKDFWTGTAPPR
jgi:hypothetical protein